MLIDLNLNIYRTVHKNIRTHIRQYEIIADSKVSNT